MIRTAFASVLALCVAETARAQATYPTFSADITLELATDATVRADDPAAELTDTTLTAEAALVLKILEGTSLNATLVFEPVADPDGDRVFGDHGLYVEEFNLQQEIAGTTLTVGKFNPAFGVAWDAAPGVYGNAFAEDYEITEKLGIGLALPFKALGGEHEVSVAAFFADTTFLSDSIIHRRGRTRRQDGGVSNTGAPSSFTFSLTGKIGSTGYNLGLQSQAAGTGDAHAQTGAVFGLTHGLKLGEAEVELLAEAVYFPQFDGGSESALYWTAGAAAPVGPVTLSAVYGLRDVEASGTDHLATVSAEIELRDGLTASLGYAFIREDGGTSHTIGARLTYEIGMP